MQNVTIRHHYHLDMIMTFEVIKNSARLRGDDVAEWGIPPITQVVIGNSCFTFFFDANNVLEHSKFMWKISSALNRISGERSGQRGTEKKCRAAESSG